MSQTQHTPDFARLEEKAREMSYISLEYARKDAILAAEMAEDLEREGCRVLKTGGYYRDEAGVYAAEIKRRDIMRGES